MNHLGWGPSTSPARNSSRGTGKSPKGGAAISNAKPARPFPLGSTTGSLFKMSIPEAHGIAHRLSRRRPHPHPSRHFSAPARQLRPSPSPRSHQAACLDLARSQSPRRRRLQRRRQEGCLDWVVSLPVDFGFTDISSGLLMECVCPRADTHCLTARSMNIDHLTVMMST